MTETKLRPICFPYNEDKDLFEHLRDERTVMRIANRFAIMFEITPNIVRSDYYIECDKPTPRGKAEALFRIIAYHLDMNVVDVRALVFWNDAGTYQSLLKFAATLPCAKRKAKDSEDIDTTVHGLVSNILDAVLTKQTAAMDTIQTDRTKHGEDKED